MAEQAIHVGDSKKLVGNIGGLLVPNVLDWAAGHNAAHKPVEFALCVAILTLSRDHLTRHLVVRLVAGQRSANVAVKGNHAIREARDLRVAGIVLEEIAEVHGPFIHPLRAGEQALDVLGTFVRGGITDEVRDCARGGNAASEVQCNASYKLVVGGAGGGGNAVFGQSLKNVTIDGVAGGGVDQTAGARAGRNRGQSGYDGLGELAGLGLLDGCWSDELAGDKASGAGSDEFVMICAEKGAFGVLDWEGIVGDQRTHQCEHPDARKNSNSPAFHHVGNLRPVLIVSDTIDLNTGFR